jgi:hypothetical protein
MWLTVLMTVFSRSHIRMLDDRDVGTKARVESSDAICPKLTTADRIFRYRWRYRHYQIGRRACKHKGPVTD